MEQVQGIATIKQAFVAASIPLNLKLNNKTTALSGLTLSFENWKVEVGKRLTAIETELRKVRNS